MRGRLRRPFLPEDQECDSQVIAGAQNAVERDSGESLISNGGAEGNRTLDLLNAIQALSQLSYGPTCASEAV